METLTSKPLSDSRARFEDYLNEKLQSPVDSKSLGTLLSSLRTQQELQAKQLAEAQEALENATKAAQDHADAVRKHIEAFHMQEADINRRLKIITQCESSDEAVHQFESSMVKLQKLDMARCHMELLKDVEALSKEALGNVALAPHLALQPYGRLRSVASSLNYAEPAAEDAPPHLIGYINQLAFSLREQIKKNLSDRLQKILDKMRWPGKDLVLTDDLVHDWVESIELLLDLQESEFEPHMTAPYVEAKEPPILFPLDVMIHPLELRFKYHFSGDKPTNRLDKPEYFLAHISDLIETYSGFFVSYLQPILDERIQRVGSDLEWNFISASTAVITALLPMLRQKISTFLPQVSTHPQLLSHFIHELINFDAGIRDTWNYSPNPYSTEGWTGVTEEVLTKQGWFDLWLQVEKDFALSRYKDIIEAQDSGQIDYDGVDPIATKPTKAAIRVNDLLETITDRYRPLSSFSQKLRFLIDIQITIFDQFHERLRSGLEAYLAITSTFGRTVQDPQANLEGIAGLDRLCRIFGSAEYLEKKMQDWGDGVFFLDLWAELQLRVRTNKDGAENMAGSMSITDIASRTSQAVTESLNHQGALPDGALFDETASAYRRLRLRSESIIISTLTSDIHSSLRSYARVSTWSSLSTPSATLSSSLHPLSSDLTPTIHMLSESLSFLARTLGVVPLRRITRQLILSIQSYIWDNILMRHTFSASGASQLASDINHLCSVVDSVLGSLCRVGPRSESKYVLGKLNDCLHLLCLKIRGNQMAEGGCLAGMGPDGRAASGQLGLWEVERRLFANNDSAREVLAELEINNLTEAEARAILEKRVEIRS